MKIRWKINLFADEKSWSEKSYWSSLLEPSTRSPCQAKQTDVPKIKAGGVRSAKGDFVSWQALQIQFWPDIKDLKNFKRHMITALEQVKMVYSGCNIEFVHGGIKLHQSPPPIRPTTIAVRCLPSHWLYLFFHRLLVPFWGGETACG